MELLRSLTISDLEPFLTDPTHLNTQAVALQIAVASYSQTPRPLLEVLVNSPHAPVAEAAQLHINWAGEISEDGQNTIEEVLKSRYLGQNDKLAVELLKIAPVPPLFLSEWVPNRYLIQALSNPYLPLRYHLQLLERLAKEPSLEPRLQVAEDPQTPLALLESLAGDLELAIRLSVSYNPSCPPELVRLVQEQHEMASDCDTDVEQLANLAQSRWECIRLAVAKNPSTSQETLLALAADKVFKIRLAVAKNSVTSAQVLAVLAESDHEIQAVVAGHDNATEEILEKLPHYPNTNVQLAARRKPESNIDLIIQQRATPGEILEKIVDRADNRQKKEIAKHPNVSSNTLEKLAEDSSSRVKLAVAQSFSISTSLREKLLEELATDEFKIIRAAVAGWSKTPLHLIEQIGSDILSKSEPDLLVCAALIGNFKTPIDLKSKIIEYFNLLNLDYDRNLELCIALKINEYLPIVQEDKRRDFFYKIHSRDIDTIAGDLYSPIYLLEQIAALGTQNAHLAKNPATPPEILVQLARQPVEKPINNVKPAKPVKPVVVRQIVFNNPSLPTLERYRLLIVLEQEREIAEANQLLANRLNSSYGLAQIVETGDQNTKIIAAGSKKTPIPILEQLAKDRDATIRQVVCQNPNLPLPILLNLTQDENLNVRLILVRNRSSQIEILKRLAQDESELVRVEVARNKNTPVEILTQLVQDSSISVCKALTGNQNTPVEVLEFLGVEKQIASVYNLKTPGNALAAVVEYTLKNSYTQKKEFEYLLRNLEGSQMPASTLEKLATNTTSWIRSDVAHHRNTPLSALEKMIDDTYEPVLWGIARNPNSSPQLLEKLLNKDDEEIAGAMVERDEIPVNLMARLLENKSQYVREVIASSHNLPPELMAKIIATEPEETVLISLARNPNLTSELLTQFIQHSNANVRTALVRHPNLTEAHWQQLAQDRALPIREAVAASANVPAQVLELLSTDEKVEVRLKVVTNSRTPESALVALTRDEDLTIRAAVATNPNLPSAQLEQLAQDEKVEVRRAVAKNPNTPAVVRASLQDLVIQPTARQTQTSPTLRGLSRLYNPQTDDLATVLSEYVESDVPFVRFVTLLHPLTPVEVLQKGAQSASWLERYAVADNPATPTEIKQQLTEDGNQIVRAVAMASLN